MSLEFKAFFLYLLALNIFQTPKIRCNINQKVKRNIDDNFGVLLKLYKMNPLRHSKVFNMFSNNILWQNRADSKGIDAMHFDEDESIKEKQMRDELTLKQIQDVIHASPSHRRKIARPEFLVDSTVAEKFSSELSLKNLAKSNLFKPKPDAFRVQDIFGHIIESKEFKDGIPDADRIVNYRIPVTVSHTTDFINLENKDAFAVERTDESVVVMR